MNKKVKTNGLSSTILVACLLTAGAFAGLNWWAYSDQETSTSNILASNGSSSEIDLDESVIDSFAIPVVVDEIEPLSSLRNSTASNDYEGNGTDDLQYISNALKTGATPYAKYYGGNKKCNEYGCSRIKVNTSNSDVLVTIKKNDKVVRHAYISGGDSYTFSFPNGTYQAFFYYGKGWNPDKEMKNGTIKGGFVSEEHFGKDQPQSLSNNILEYSLILQPNGNFSTSPSDPEEAL